MSPGDPATGVTRSSRRRRRAGRRAGGPRRPGRPSTWPCWSSGMALCGTSTARMPDLLGAVDVVERPVADEHDAAPGRARRPRPSPRGTPPGAASSTGSRWSRRRRRSGRARRRGGTPPRGARGSRACCDSTPTRMPRSRRPANSGGDVRVGVRVRLPELVVGGQRAPRAARRPARRRPTRKISSSVRRPLVLRDRPARRRPRPRACAPASSSARSPGRRPRRSAATARAGRSCARA